MFWHAAKCPVGCMCWMHVCISESPCLLCCRTMLGLLVVTAAVAMTAAQQWLWLCRGWVGCPILLSILTQTTEFWTIAPPLFTSSSHGIMNTSDNQYVSNKVCVWVCVHCCLIVWHCLFEWPSPRQILLLVSSFGLILVPLMGLPCISDKPV